MRRPVKIKPQQPLRWMSAGNGSFKYKKNFNKTSADLRYSWTRKGMLLCNKTFNSPDITQHHAIRNLIVLISHNIMLGLAHLERGNLVLPRDKVIDIVKIFKKDITLYFKTSIYLKCGKNSNVLGHIERTCSPSSKRIWEKSLSDLSYWFRKRK